MAVAAALPLMDAPELFRQLAVGLAFLLLGLLLPRPRFLEARTLIASGPAGLFLRRFALGLQGAAIVREVWCACTRPGTLAALAAAARRAAAGKGFSLVYGGQEGRAEASAPVARRGSGDLDWYVTDADLAHFRAACEDADTGPSWGDAPLLERDYGDLTYAAWRRPTPDGKTEYKSVTVALDATAEEFTDFYLDDDARAGWDGMIAEHESLEVGHPAHRCQVVRWRRSFPFAFLSDREYVIARRAWRAPCGAIYVATKTLSAHPAAPEQRGVVRMDSFYSVWRSRTVPCPRGSGAPACETTLLHREDLKIPENLARFAIRAGMPGFVGKMRPAVRAFVEGRRARGVAPHAADDGAYGVAGVAPPLPPPRRGLVPAKSAPQMSYLARAASGRLGGGAADAAPEGLTASPPDAHAPLPAVTPAALRRSALPRALAAVVVAAVLAGQVGRVSGARAERRRRVRAAPGAGPAGPAAHPVEVA